jgi:hypothetical protein
VQSCERRAYVLFGAESRTYTGWTSRVVPATLRAMPSDKDIALLEFFFASVVRRLERRTTLTPRKVSRTLLLITYLETRSEAATAQRLQVSRSLVGQIVRKAVRLSARVAGL